MKQWMFGMLVLAGLIGLPVLAAININTATQSELEAVRGLGPVKAKAIIVYREANRGFKSLADLDHVRGFGKASIEKLKGELTIGVDKPSQSVVDKPIQIGVDNPNYIKWTHPSRQ